MPGVPNVSRLFRGPQPGWPLAIAVNVTSYRDHAGVVKDGALKVIDRTREMCNQLEVIDLQEDSLENSYIELHKGNVVSSNGYLYSRSFLSKYRDYFDGVDSYVPMGVAVGRDFDVVIQSLLAIKLTGAVQDVSTLFAEEDGFSIWAKMEESGIRALNIENGPEVNLNFIADAISPYYNDLIYGPNDRLVFVPQEIPPELRIVRVASWRQLERTRPKFKEEIHRVMFNDLQLYHGRVFANANLNIFQYVGGSVFEKRIAEGEEGSPRVNFIYWRSAEELIRHVFSQHLAA